MVCAGCDTCGDGLYQVHVTLGRHPGSKLKVPNTKVHVLVNLMPDGKWRKEWVTTTNVTGTERDAVKVMRDIASSMEKVTGVKRQKIEVPVKKLQPGRQVLYVEAHVKAILSLPNLDRALLEHRNVSVNAEKPGSFIMTFRDRRFVEVREAIKLAGLHRYLGFDPERPIQYEAAIHDDNPALDDDWINQPWLTNSNPSPSRT